MKYSKTHEIIVVQNYVAAGDSLSERDPSPMAARKIKSKSSIAVRMYHALVVVYLLIMSVCHKVTSICKMLME